MQSLANFSFTHHPTPLNLHRPFSSRPPISTVNFPKSNFKPISATLPKTPKTLATPKLPLAAVKTTLITAVAASAVFLSRFSLKPALAAAVAAPPPPAQTTSAESVSDQEKEEKLQSYLVSHPEDVQALRELMELKVKSQKVNEAIGVIDRLIELQPEDVEWPLMKAHMHSYDGDQNLAKTGFNEILEKDPLRVEAYHGLVMAATDSNSELKEVEKRVLEAMEKCKKLKRKDDVRDFHLLLAQIKVIEGDYDGAVKTYEKLVKEEPRDFRPYLCLGIIYTLLRKNDAAEKNFEKYRRLVPKAHPYAQYFDDNMIATKLFAQKAENEKAYAKS